MRERFADISTRWSVLKGPPREALDYLFRVYGPAILAYVRARLARGDFAPMKAQDGEDIVQDYFLRLGKTEWLKKPDPKRGRFRPFFIQRLIFFLRERRSAAIQKKDPVVEGETDAAAPDPLDAHLDREWRAATIHETLRRIRKHNEAWHAVLGADLERGDETDQEMADRLGKSLESFRSLLKRARAAFRELYPVVDERLDGFGGDTF